MDPVPRLAIVMLIVGTRGDVQPFIALGKALLRYGHRVRLATHEKFRSFVREHGLEFYPLAGDPADLMSFMVKNAGIVPSVSSIIAGDISKNRLIISEILQSTWKACTDVDDETGVPFVAEAIIANPPSYGHIHCAQKLQIPLHIMFTMPWSSTNVFPHPLCRINNNYGPIQLSNRLSYKVMETLVSDKICDYYLD
jgi:UDP:flavonoid glycosyltransferase YjiC (YdhE family)